MRLRRGFTLASLLGSVGVAMMASCRDGKPRVPDESFLGSGGGAPAVAGQAGGATGGAVPPSGGSGSSSGGTSSDAGVQGMLEPPTAYPFDAGDCTAPIPAGCFVMGSPSTSVTAFACLATPSGNTPLELAPLRPSTRDR
jgi:hypothetical protein